jgi:hypothetical protein
MAEQRFSVPTDPTKTAATQRTSQRAERAIKPDVRAADLQEEMAEQRFSVPTDPTKTAATQRTSQRAERAIKHSATRELLGVRASHWFP